MSNALRSKKHGNKVIWALMALLIAGLGGFGASNFGHSVNSIGQVGDREIDVRDYARVMRREMAAMSAQFGKQVSFAEAQGVGLDQQVLAQVFAAAAIDNAAVEAGISIGDDQVRDRLTRIPAFHGFDGTFNRDTYVQALRQEGMTEKEFEAQLRDEIGRSLLQGAVMGAAAAPAEEVTRIAAWALERRDFTLGELTSFDLTAPAPAPDDSQIEAYYTAHPEPYTSPETRRITYVWLTPDMLTDKVELDEQALRDAYDQRSAEFVKPERRLVDRLVYPDQKTAEEAKARYDAGTATFEALAAERGLALTDIDLGETTRESLGAAGEPVFALQEPGVVGPVATDLGPALFAMNGILEAETTTFEQARPDLAGEAALAKAQRQIAEQSNDIEDLLASGATLEEVAKEKGLTLGTIAFSAESEDQIAGYSEFREAANAAKTEDFPQLAPLADGGVFALRLDGIDPPALKPLADVRDQVIADWTKEETHRLLVEQANAVLAAAGKADAADDRSGGPLAATGIVTTRYDGFSRAGHIDGASPAVAEKVFTLKEGESAVVDDGERVFIVVLGKVTPADPADRDVAATSARLETQLSQSIAQDMFQLFVREIEQTAQIRVDQAAVSAANAQLN